MNHKRLITLQAGDAYTFSVKVPGIEGAGLTSEDMGGCSAQHIGPGETVEVRVEAKPKPIPSAEALAKAEAAAPERKIA